MEFKLQHWGVVVGPRETVKCNPGEFCFQISQIALHAGKGNGDVRIFVKAGDKEILLGTLSDDKYPHYRTDMSFEEEFELLHTSETRSISIIGFKCSKLGRKSGSSTEEDHNSKDTESGSEKLTAPNPTATQSSALEKKRDPEKLQTNVGGSDDDVSDEDFVDSEEGETKDDEDSSNDDDDKNFQKHAKYRDRFASKTKYRNRLAVTPLKSPPGKKAKMTTPSKSNNTVSGTGMRSGYVHVATPYPSKNVKNRPSLLKKNTPSTSDRPKQPAGSYACASCSRTFYSYIALKTHCKVKKHKRSPHK